MKKTELEKLVQQVTPISNNNIIYNLDKLGLISIYGPDCEVFLQGQLTCDVQQVIQNKMSIMGAHCNAQGRVLTCFRLFYSEQNYYMVVPKLMLDYTISCLRKYILNSKVNIVDSSTTLSRIGINLNRTEIIPELLPKKILPGQIINFIGVIIIRLYGTHPRFEVHGTDDKITKFLTKFRDNVTLEQYEQWHLLDIISGIPAIYPQTAGIFLPQMLNLQAMDGISFSKGCYTGQEIVARSHYRSAVKRIMFLAYITNVSFTPIPGDEILVIQSNKIKHIGKLVDISNFYPSISGYMMLVVLPKNYERDSILKLNTVNGPEIYILCDNW